MLKAIHIESQNITHNNHVGSPTTAEGSVQFHNKVLFTKHQHHPKRGPTQPSRECTLSNISPEKPIPQGVYALSGTKGINYLALGCGINAEKSLVSPSPTFHKSVMSRRVSREVAKPQTAGLTETLIK